MRIEPVTAERWDDLERLFGPNGAYSDCWCTWWTWRSAGVGPAPPGAAAGASCDARCVDGREPGLLAYDGDEPVGWCAVAPRESYARLTSPGPGRTGASTSGRPGS